MNKSNEVDIPRIEDFIKNLDQKDLIYLNKIIVDRIKILQQVKSSENMAKFHVGQRVGFSIDDGEIKKGRIIRLNKKTISLISDDNEEWKVAPVLLKNLD